MILREATIKYSGNDPDLLKPKSNKRICCSCDHCGKVRWIQKIAYRSLCQSCAGLNKKPFTNEHKINISKSKIGKTLSDKHKKNLCGKRPQMCGSKNPFYGKGFFGANNGMYGKRGELAPNWKGGFDKGRSYVLRESRCIKLNERFKNSEFHHITKSVGIFIPKNLHKSIYHSMKTNENINIINKLALNYLINGL